MNACQGEDICLGQSVAERYLGQSVAERYESVTKKLFAYLGIKRGIVHWSDNAPTQEVIDTLENLALKLELSELG
jgi:hypothetical protein